MTCREFADFIADYVSGELSAEVRQRFERHLHLCANCEKYLAIYKATTALGKGAFDDDETTVPSEVPDDLVNAILSARHKA